MATVLDSRKYTNLQGLYLKGDNKVGSGSGAIRFPNLDAAAISTVTEYGLYVKNGSLIFFNAGAETTVGSAGGGVASWDSLYDLDTALTIDGASLTFDGTHASNDVITITNATGSGDALQITQSGTGKDINGTSSTWSVSKAGVLLVTSIADSVTNATLQVDGDGSGGVDICSTSTGGITLGDDATLASAKVLTLTGTGGSNILVMTAGDVLLSDSSLTMVDADNAVSFSLTNSTITTANVAEVISTSLTTGHGLLMTVNGLTEGFMFKGVTTAAGLTTGGFVSYNDGSERFAVKADGAVTIATGVNSTVALLATGIQTSDDMVRLTSSGVTATAKAILQINSSGASASGSSQIRIAPSGTPDEGSTGIKFVGASKLMQAMNLDADCASNDVALINGSGNIANDKGILQLTSDGATQSAGGTVLRVVNSGTPATGSIGIEGVFTTKDMYMMYLAGGSATNSGVFMTSTGAIANNKAVLEVTATGTPANAGASIVRIDGTGVTDTNKSSGLKIDTSGKDMPGLIIDSDSLTASAVLVTGGGDLAANKAALEIVVDGTPAASTASGLRVDLSGATATNNPYAVNVKTTSKDAGGLYIAADGATLSPVVITGAGAIATGKAMFALANTGTPAAADSFLALLDYSGATMTNNPVAVKVSGGATTASTVQITDSSVKAAGAGALELINTNAGAVGSTLILRHTSATPANSDVVASIEAWGNDSGAGSQQWTKIHSIVTDVTATSEDADLIFSVVKAGTLTQLLQLDSDVNGVLIGSGAAGVVSSNGAQDLTLETNSGTNSGTVTIANGANGDISVTPNGTGQVQLTAPSYGQVTNAGDTAPTLTVAQSGLIICENTIARAYTLPTTATSAGVWYTFKKTTAAAAAITLTPQAGNIDGVATNAEMDAQYDTLTIVCDGSNWHIAQHWIH